MNKCSRCGKEIEIYEHTESEIIYKCPACGGYYHCRKTDEEKRLQFEEYEKERKKIYNDMVSIFNRGKIVNEDTVAANINELKNKHTNFSSNDPMLDFLYIILYSKNFNSYDKRLQKYNGAILSKTAYQEDFEEYLTLMHDYDVFNVQFRVNHKFSIRVNKKHYGKLANKYESNYSYGETVRLSCIDNGKGQFKGWYANGKKVSEQAIFDYKMPDKNTSVVAKFGSSRRTKVKIIISMLVLMLILAGTGGYLYAFQGQLFGANEIVFFNNETKIDTIKVGMNKSFKVDTPQKIGYKFVGYYDNVDVENGKKVIDEFGKSVVKYKSINKEYNLYAKWEKVPYTVNCVITEGQISNDYASTFQAYIDERLPQMFLPTLTNYNGIFYGWEIRIGEQSYQVANKSGAINQEYRKLTQIAYNLGENLEIKLYPMWQRTIKFLNPDGTNQPEAQTILDGDTFKLPSAGNKVENAKYYTFDGWYYGSQLIGKAYATVEQNWNRNVVLTAKWVQIEKYSNYKYLTSVDDLSSMSNSSGNFLLLNDIVVGKSIQPIVNFSGLFDGNNFTISQVSIIGKTENDLFEAKDVQYGLFACNNGTIKNLNLLDVTVSYTASICIFDKYVAAGSVAGVNSGTIKNCKIENLNVTINLTAEKGNESEYEHEALRKKIDYETSGAIAFSGGFAGINKGGVIEECQIVGDNNKIVANYINNGNNYNASYVYVGGVCALMSGGTVKSNEIKTKMNIDFEFTYTDSAIIKGGVEPCANLYMGGAVALKTVGTVENNSFIGSQNCNSKVNGTNFLGSDSTKANVKEVKSNSVAVIQN